MTFEECWKFIQDRCEAQSYPMVQDKQELEYVFNLMKGYSSYLEVGSAEGNSLYVLAHALEKGASITFIDYGEAHTTYKRDEIVSLLIAEGYKVRGILGNSHDEAIIKAAQAKYDIVMIDAGHSYEDVKQDIENYLPMASKYCIFHDIELLGVRKAFDEMKTGTNHHYFIRSESYGYGIIKI